MYLRRRVREQGRQRDERPIGDADGVSSPLHDASAYTTTRSRFAFWPALVKAFPRDKR
jgi:hypothetical protein